MTSMVPLQAVGAPDVSVEALVKQVEQLQAENAALRQELSKLQGHAPTSQVCPAQHNKLPLQLFVKPFLQTAFDATARW